MKCYKECLNQLKLPAEEQRNAVKDLYALFSDDELTDEIARLVTPPDMRAEVHIVYQKVEDLHKACPNHLGDWYFTGNYPTPGGTKGRKQVVCILLWKANNKRAFINSILFG